MNKTSKYLIRSLLLYDKPENVRKLLTENMTSGAMHGNREGLFFCYNFKQLDNSKEILEYARTRPYYVDDYLVGHPIYGDCHMVQFRPNMRVYRKFLASKYSSMYNSKELEIVSNDKRQRAWFVLRRHEALVKEKIKEYNVNPDVIGELDSLIDPNEEFFNYPVIDSLTFRQMQNEQLQD